MSIKEMDDIMIDLRNFGLKNTKTREKILEILNDSTKPLTVEEIYAQTKELDINLSTVYRTLTSFVERHLVDKEIDKDGKALYFILKEHHHHVLICLKCNKQIELSYCPYDSIKTSIYNDTGFLIQNHNIELYGLCPKCQKETNH